MELRITKFDESLRMKLKLQALKMHTSMRKLVIELLRDAVKSFK